MNSYVFLSETKEAAFVYALASAAVVHTVADQCVKYADKLHYCGCDSGLKDEAANEKSVGCSPDMNFSIKFAKQFVDRREDNIDSLQHRTFVLHNNKIGRLVSSYIYNIMDT